MHTLLPPLGRGVLVSIIIWWTMYTLRVAVISNWNEGLTSGLGKFDSNMRLLVSGGGGSSSSLSCSIAHPIHVVCMGLLVVLHRMQVQNMWNVCN